MIVVVVVIVVEMVVVVIVVVIVVVVIIVVIVVVIIVVLIIVVVVIVVSQNLQRFTCISVATGYKYISLSHSPGTELPTGNARKKEKEGTKTRRENRSHKR